MHLRPAEIGDEGVVVGLEHHDSISTLVLQVAEGEQMFLYGDRRMVAGLVAAFLGEWVEVVEAEGSSYGAHGIQPLDAVSHTTANPA